MIDLSLHLIDIIKEMLSNKIDELFRQMLNEIVSMYIFNMHELLRNILGGIKSNKIDELFRQMLNEIVSMGIFNMSELYPNNSHIILKTGKGGFEGLIITDYIADNLADYSERGRDAVIIGVSISMLALSIFPTAQEEAFIINHGLKILGAIAVIVGITAHYYSVYYYNLIMEDIIAHYAKNNVGAENLLKLKELLSEASYGAMFEADFDYQNRLKWYFEFIAPFDPLTTLIMNQPRSSVTKPSVHRALHKALYKAWINENFNWEPRQLTLEEWVKLQTIQQEKEKLNLAAEEMEEVSKDKDVMTKAKVQTAKENVNEENVYEKVKKEAQTKQKNYENSKKKKSTWEWNTTF